MKLPVIGLKEQRQLLRLKSTGALGIPSQEARNLEARLLQCTLIIFGHVRGRQNHNKRNKGRPMLDRESLEMTVLQMTRIQGEKLDRHTLYTVRNEIRNALAAKERYRRMLEAQPYQWKKPRPPR